MEKSKKGIPLCQGKSSLSPLQQLSCPLMSIWPTRRSRLLSSAVDCAQALALNSAVSLNFHHLKTFPHLPLTQLCGSASGLHRGHEMGQTEVWHVFRTDQSYPAGLPGRGGCHPPPAAQGHGEQSCSRLTKWFHPPTAT